jgi:DNA repair protein RadA/Sms
VLEAKKLGFKKCIIPKENAAGIEIGDITVLAADNIYEALDEVLGG